MENELTQTQLDAVEATLCEMGRGLGKCSLMNALLLELFPNENQTFLAYWAGYRYNHMAGAATRESQEWILKDMVNEVVRGSAQLWYKGWLQEYKAIVY